METLMLYTAHKLAEQYHGRLEEQTFSELISAAEDSNRKEGEEDK